MQARSGSMIGLDSLEERDQPLAALRYAAERAWTGRGELAVVAGEAGAGKTVLVRQFVSSLEADHLVLWGACDPLAAPRPFGPLIDAAGQVDDGIAQRLASGVERAEALAITLSLLDGTVSNGLPTLLVLEDMHWADEATLDVLTFLGRRVGTLAGLMIITYRDDEVVADHPLRVRLGELSTSIRQRIQLSPLSPAAVERLADGTGLDPVELHTVTAGNPFFVTEALHGDGAVLPASISDAVIARAARLGMAERRVLDAASIVPGRAEVWLIEAIVGGGDTRDGVDGCVARGLLVPDRSIDGVVFRHELARLVVEEALPGARRHDYHVRALDCLRHRPGTPALARIAFHAAEAEDAKAVATYAPAAAREAARLGAYREAARHLESALRLGGDLSDFDRGDLLLQLAVARTNLFDPESALAACDTAAAAFAHDGDVERHAESLVKSCRPLVTLGRQPEADARATSAAALLEGRAPSSAAAMVAMVRSSNRMLARAFDDAETFGRQALELSRLVGDDETLAETCIQSGIGLVMSGDDGGLTRIHEGIALARRRGWDALGVARVLADRFGLRRTSALRHRSPGATSWCRILGGAGTDDVGRLHVGVAGPVRTRTRTMGRGRPARRATPA